VNTHGKTLSYSGAVAAEDDRQTGTYCRVDLHGLRVREALEFIYSIIERHRASQTQMTVEAITGIGRGSAGGQAR
jgi:DNA-nicking Smr family endonuclease